MMTRSEYLAVPLSEQGAAHRRYYGQFVNKPLICRVIQFIGADNLRKSTDEHFNDIPLGRWDMLAHNIGPLAVSFQSLGDFPTLAGLVCIAKEAAAQYLENTK